MSDRRHVRFETASLASSLQYDELEVEMQVSTLTPRVTRFFEFQDLEALPCGCVAAAYRTRQLGLMLVSLEAKGVHCRFEGHAVGQVLHLGEPPADEEGL
jgi:hypothetical protein